MTTETAATPLHGAVGCAWGFLAMAQVLGCVVFGALPCLVIPVAFAVLGVAVVVWPRPPVVAGSIAGGVILIILAAMNWLQNPINGTSAIAFATLGLWIAVASITAVRRSGR